VRHPFVHDDVVFILQNPYIGRWDNIADAFLNPSIPQSFHGLVTPYYRPLLEVLYRVQYALFGFDPHGFHLVNVILHIANGLLLFVFLRRVLGAPSVAFLTAVIFVVHPVQTQAVACVSGISNLLCAFFLLMSLVAYAESAAGDDHRWKLSWFVLALVSFVAALFSKEQAVFAFLVFVFYEVCLGRRTEGRMVRLYRLAILGVAAAGYLFCRQLLFGPLSSAIFENMGEFKLRILTIPRIIETFIGLLFFPAGLHYYRSVDILAPYVVPLTVLAILTVLTVMIVGQLPSDRQRRAWFGLAWFFAFLIPVLNIVPLVNEYSFVAASEHGLYLPLAGFFVFFLTASSCAFKKVFERHPAAVRAGVLILVATLSLLTVRQNTYWRGEIPLFERALAFEPQLGRVHLLLAKAYLFNGRIDDAIKEFRKAQGIFTEYAGKATTLKARQFYLGFLKGSYADQAQCYLAKNDIKDALNQYDAALRLDPSDDVIRTNRALAFVQAGRMAEAVQDLEVALQSNPGNIMAANDLSICLIQQGQTARARGILTRILAQDPSFTPARDNLERLNRSQPPPG
jgi:tetratricopeptide (TPR) repeat protein